MPSSLIIVALAAAWLVVLVPMVVRKRQAIARTADSELAARVVRSGSGAEEEGEEEFAMAEAAGDGAEHEPVEVEEFEDEPSPSARAGERRYRPGRGGFDPEAAELAARAKYAFRQRVVLAVIVLAVIAGFAAGFLSTTLWWAHGALDAILVAYLVYLRRQVRIENEIRQRRLARLNRGRVRREAPHLSETEEYEQDVPERAEGVRVEPRPSSAPRVPGNAVVLDIDDEDPEFHELDDPGQLPFRRAAGE
ncbi:hypothetical protein FNH05_30510 [Amycolatopsis rhizosphaerae]|uniref:Uncharacterized protein n=1 Tax=Amycolatopsis rhizosphaerae TaxID=2053003 RepID=A0A558AVM8_9PSEU|nr:gephyrin-like molybdotransferase receptor GlpR [Amycolatopsis rhizosphaerae]TVT28319.1 hypothetical protein FNH05_30510 [Amycolatopsis rhizosphaerae]